MKNLFNFFKKEKKKTILFLDIDGVLNTSDDLEIIVDKFFPKMNLEQIKLLNSLKEDFKIILSSDWRIQLTREEIEFYFNYKDIQLELIDIINNKIEKVEAIKEYINKNQINKYIVIDDDIDITKHFNLSVRINNGILEKNINEIKNINTNFTKI